MDIPVPDFDFDEEPESSPVAPHPSSSAITFALRSDPMTSFTGHTPNGLLFDMYNPIYETKTCTLYISRSNDNFYVLKSSNNIKLLNREYQMYKEVGNCVTIIEALEFWVQENRAFIQLELASGGAITNLFSDFPKCEVWRLISHISYALFQIHSSGFIHLDVSPSNILQASAGDFVLYKLADFGTVIPDGTFNAQFEGAGPYLSPEALQYPDSPYQVSSASDVWSFGAVLYEVIAHKRVPRDAEGYSSFRDGTFDFSAIPEEFSFVVKMLDPNPTLRPTIQEIMQFDEVTKEMNCVFAAVADVPKPQFQSMFGKKSIRRTSFDSI